MKLNSSNPEETQEKHSSERGQSIVLIAMAFIGLLAFVGLATDAGLAFSRSSEFSKAVDAASLAAVLEIDPGTTDTTTADFRAKQFLSANGWTTDTLIVFDSKTSLTARGIIPQYTLTVTWEIPVFFLRVIGMSGFPVTHAATAAYFSQSELYTPTAREDGQIRLANQFISGQNGCSKEGDPVSPLRSTADQPNIDYPFFGGVYRYRIRIPIDYTQTVGSLYSTIRIELFDPDTVNRQYGNQVNFKHADSLGGANDQAECASSSGPGDRCVVPTGEQIDAAFENPIWLYRVDENWDMNCNLDSSNGEGDSQTKFELYYNDQFGQRQVLATYIDDNSNAANTDLQWVSPCEPGPGCTVPTESGKFEVDLNTLPRDLDGGHSIYLDVSSTGGTSFNAWDLWAGPQTEYFTVERGAAPLETNANLRNLQLANRPFDYSTQGIRVLALGRQPLNNYIDGETVRMAMAPLDIDLAEQTIFVSTFDYDKSPPPRFSFSLNTVPTSVPDPSGGGTVDPSVAFNICANVVADPSLEHSGQCAFTPHDPLETSCDGTLECNNRWMLPQLHVLLPAPDIFAGGTFIVSYAPDADAHVWEYAASSGNPFLTK